MISFFNLTKALLELRIQSVFSCPFYLLIFTSFQCLKQHTLSKYSSVATFQINLSRISCKFIGGYNFSFLQHNHDKCMPLVHASQVTNHNPRQSIPKDLHGIVLEISFIFNHLFLTKQMDNSIIHRVPHKTLKKKKENCINFWSIQSTN